jgi:hypothetical protein
MSAASRNGIKVKEMGENISIPLTDCDDDLDRVADGPVRIRDLIPCMYLREAVATPPKCIARQTMMENQNRKLKTRMMIKTLLMREM